MKQPKLSRFLVIVLAAAFLATNLAAQKSTQTQGEVIGTQPGGEMIVQLSSGGTASVGDRLRFVQVSEGSDPLSFGFGEVVKVSAAMLIVRVTEGEPYIGLTAIVETTDSTLAKPTSDRRDPLPQDWGSVDKRIGRALEDFTHVEAEELTRLIEARIAEIRVLRRHVVDDLRRREALSGVISPEGNLSKFQDSCSQAAERMRRYIFNFQSHSGPTALFMLGGLESRMRQDRIRDIRGSLAEIQLYIITAWTRAENHDEAMMSMQEVALGQVQVLLDRLQTEPSYAQSSVLELFANATIAAMKALNSATQELAHNCTADG